MRHILITVIGLSISFISTTASAKRTFQISDYYELNRQEQRRYIGVVENFYRQLEKAQKKYNYSKRSKKNHFRYYNSFLLQILTSTAVAEGERICVNNGLIAKVPEGQCKQASNWGFDMTSHLKPLVDAGLKMQCGESSGSIKSQGCGLLGLKSDFSLSCSANKTDSCLSSLDRNALQKLLSKCRPKDQGGEGAEKFAEGDKSIACAPVIKHWDDQMQMMNETCHSEKAKEEMSSKLVRAVKRVCSASQTAMSEIVEKKEELNIVGPQEEKEAKDLVVVGEEISDRNLGGSLNHCLSKKDVNVKQVSIEPLRSGKKVVDIVEMNGCTELKSSTISYKCKSTTSVVESNDPAALFGHYGKKADTGMLIMNDSVLKGIDGNSNEDTVQAALGEMKKNLTKELSTLKKDRKGCFVVTPPLKDKEMRRIFATKLNRAISTANKNGDESYCTVLDGSDMMNVIEARKTSSAPVTEEQRKPSADSETKKEEVKSEDKAVELSSSMIDQELGKEICTQMLAKNEPAKVETGESKPTPEAKPSSGGATSAQ